MNCYLTGISDKPHDLSYVEKRSLKAKVLEELARNYQKELAVWQSMEPEVINPEILDHQLLDLKAMEKELLTELAVKKIELCNTWKECIELRFGEDQKNEIELTKAKIAVERVKAQYVQNNLIFQ